MKTCIKVSAIFILLFLLNACGVITKTRYGNGLKCNLEFKGLKRDRGITSTTNQSKKSGKICDGKEITISEFPATTESSRFLQDIPMIQYYSESNRLKTSKLKKLMKMQRMTSHPQALVKLPALKQRRSSIPLEPTSEVAGWMFYLSLAGLIISTYLIAIPILPLLCFFGMIAGFILAVAGLQKIKQSNHEYGGFGLDISIIVIFGLIILYFVAMIALLIYLIAAL